MTRRTDHNSVAGRRPTNPSAEVSRTIVTLGLWLLAVISWSGVELAHAGFPHLISFQGRLEDTTGSPVVNGPHDVIFRLYDDPDIGALLWQETQTVTTSGGVFAVLLGSIDTVPSSAFFLDSIYLEIEPQGFSPVLPRTRLTMVPYAWHARDADLVGGASAAELEESVEIDLDISAHAAISGAHHEKTLNAAELITGTLAEDRLPQGAIDSTEIEGESIGANRLVDEPGVAQSFVALRNLTTTATVIDSAYVTLPKPGFLLVMSTGWFYEFHVAGVGSYTATVSLSSSRTAHDESYSAKFSVISAAPTGHNNESFSVSRVLPVAAGQTKIFLVGSLAGTGGPRVENVHTTAIYFPTAYGNVDLLAE